MADGADSSPGPGVHGGEEGTGATSSPLRSAARASASPLASDVTGRGEGGGVRDICGDVVERIVAGGRLDPSAIDHHFRALLEAHFGRFPESYQQYARFTEAENVFIHMKLLKEAADVNAIPPFHVQFLRVERLNTGMDVIKESCDEDDLSTRSGILCSNVHEIVLGYIQNPRFRRQLSSLLSDLGLNIKSMHLFTTSDGYYLDAFTVAGWPAKNTVDLVESLQESILRYKKLISDESPAESLDRKLCSIVVKSWTHTRRTRKNDTFRRLQNIKMRKRAEKVKEEKKMESFKSILSDSISFLFPTMLAIFTSSLSFGEHEKPFLILLCALGGLLILLTMALSHGVEDGPGRTAVVSQLTLGTVIYVFAVLMYCLYKFFSAGRLELLALGACLVHFFFGAAMLTLLWGHLFK